MGTIYDEQINEIAEKIREAGISGWGDFEVGPSIEDLSGLNQLESDDALDSLLLEIDTQQSLDEPRLVAALEYCCKSISDLGISPCEAVWRKYYINFITYSIPYSIALNEINREAILGGGYQEGIFDSIRTFSRKDALAMRLREEAINNAQAYYMNAKFPVGEKNIGIMQLVFRDWLLKLGRPFTPSDIYQLMMSEVQELKESQDRWDRAYEASDVIICILHMFSVYDRNIGEVI